MSSVRSQYRVTGLVETDELIANVTIDRKNNSIHMHFYRKMSGNQRRPILVKDLNTKFPEGKDADVVKQVIIGELANKKVQIENMTLLKEGEMPVEDIKYPHRIIIRFKK